MKLNLFIIFYLFLVASIKRLNIFSEQCLVYFDQLATYDLVAYTIASKNIFYSSISYTENTSYAVANISYKDSLYNNQTYFGIVQEDGKQPELTCFDLKILSYQSELYLDGKEFDNSNIISYQNDETLERIYSFQIKLEELQVDLLQSTNNFNFIAQGFLYQCQRGKTMVFKYLRQCDWKYSKNYLHQRYTVLQLSNL